MVTNARPQAPKILDLATHGEAMEAVLAREQIEKRAKPANTREFNFTGESRTRRLQA